MTISSLLPHLKVVMAVKPLQCVASMMLSGCWPYQNTGTGTQLTVDRTPSVSASSPHVCLLSIVVPKTNKGDKYIKF